MGITVLEVSIGLIIRRRQREEGREKREEGRRKREEGREKKEEGRGLTAVHK
jgi:hypothetical protein